MATFGNESDGIDLESAAKKLSECDFEKERTLFADEIESFHELTLAIADAGEKAVPVLQRYLGNSKFVSIALGRLGTDSSIELLAEELESSDWRRVEAAALGLGNSKRQKALRILQTARDDGRVGQSAEVMYAFNWALAELDKVGRGNQWLEIDKEHPLDQIRMVSQMWQTISDKDRPHAIQWAVEMAEALSGRDLINNVEGESSHSATEMKAITWNLLAITTYYLCNPSDRSFDHKCPEAAFCWQQSLRYSPEDENYRFQLDRVS